MDTLVSRINEAQADILFVALGSPRQEIWIQQQLPRLKVKVVQGVGGTLDTIAGTVKRAPSWMMAIGLEWFYRLLKQPSRARRDLNLIRFTAEILRIKLAGEVLNRPVSPGHNT
jgi:N-acetylglucosaminyldiphosphoundecaprenol N-acetyl-beta-D-mannosaminyltransferase